MSDSNGTMSWERLITAARWDERRSGSLAPEVSKPPANGDSRNPFERDYGRILYSSAFRRLQDKTQVFPLGRNDYVRTRLTHSLEVSYVGRSLGEALGERLADSVFEGMPQASHLGARVGAAVASACLAHDIGNPPFGHAGEKAIEGAFEKRGYPISFEGNAQGFRLLTKIGGDSMDGFGLKLTAGTLGAFMKYPCSESYFKAVKDGDARPVNRLEAKKFSFADSEIEAARFVADACGLILREDAGAHFAVSRHPFAFLVEAADDLCYLIADLEDSFNNKIVTYAEAKQYLSAFWENDSRRAAIEARIADLEAQKECRRAVNFMRATAIGQGIRAATRAFDAHESAILSGSLQSGLFECSDLREKISELRRFSVERIYSEKSVESVELMGFQVMRSLADFFLDWVETPGDTKGRKIASVYNLKDGGTAEARVGEVVDYISGMTDSFALATYRKINGIAER